MIDSKKVEIAHAHEEKPIRELLDSRYQGIKRLFVFAYDDTESDNQVSIDSFKKCFLPRVRIENHNIEIDRRNFYDQPINDLIKQCNEVRKVSTGQSINSTRWWLYERLFIRFCLFQKQLQTNCS